MLSKLNAGELEPFHFCFPQLIFKILVEVLHVRHEILSLSSNSFSSNGGGMGGKNFKLDFSKLSQKYIDEWK